MAFSITFSHGEPVMTDYTPTAAVTGGTVVVLGNTTAGTLTCGVAHHDIAANTTGAVATGGGVYDGTSLQNTANYLKVWWDVVNTKFSTTSTVGPFFGYIEANGGLGVNTTVRVRHFPFG